MLSKDEILSTLINRKEVLKSLGAARLGLFGSFVRNTPNPESDIDIIIEFENGRKTYDNFISIAYFLEDIFKTKVELVTLNSLSSYIKPYILKEVEYVSF